MQSVLEGIRVIDFGRFIAGPFCGALLADFGADVIRVDKVGGSEDRYLVPIASGGEGALYMQVNRNKRSLALDIDRAEGREVVRRLVARADVVVVNMPQQTLEDLGLDYPTLSAIQPRLVLATMSAFGSGERERDRVGFDGVGQAMSGSLYLSGPPGQPSRSHGLYVDYGTAMSAAMGVMAALLERQRSGRGQLVETSLMKTALNIAAGTLIEEGVTGINRQSSGNRGQTAGPSDIFKVSDGWILIQVVGNPLFKRWARLLGQPDLMQDPRFKDDMARGENGQALSELMQAWCTGRSRAQALQALEQARIPAGPVYSPREVLADEALRNSGMFQPMDFPGMPRPAPLVQPPASLSRTPAQIRHRAPTLGEHGEAILSEVGYNAAEIAQLKALRIV